MKVTYPISERVRGEAKLHSFHVINGVVMGLIINPLGEMNLVQATKLEKERSNKMEIEIPQTCEEAKRCFIDILGEMPEEARNEYLSEEHERYMAHVDLGRNLD